MLKLFQRKPTPALIASGPRYARSLIVAFAAILPALLMVPPVHIMSSQRAAGEVAVTAEVVRRQIENMARSTLHTLEMAAALTDRPCSKVQSELQSIVTLRPYLRGLLLVQNHRVSCSVLHGSLDLPLTQYSLPDPFPDQTVIRPLTGSPLAPERPVLGLTYSVGHGNGALTTIDGQYILDMQAAASRGGLFKIELRFDGQRLQLGPDSNVYALQQGADVQVSRSDLMPMEVHATIDPSHLASYRNDIWLAYLPFLLIACLLSGYGMHWLLGSQRSMRGELMRAMRTGQFYMAYQPVITLADGTVSSVEALLRWKHPRHGNVPPGRFIPLAEEIGFLPELTRHIFSLVAADVHILGRRFPHRVAINISAPDLARPAFVEEINQLLRQIEPYGVQLVLEITEREAVPDSDIALTTLNTLRDRQVLWALDDFGTGYSSLAYLQQLQPSFVKIDRIFIQGAGTDTVNTVVLDAIIELSHRLNLTLVAEGIETESQFIALKQKGVHLGQGYWLGYPLPIQEFKSWLDERQRKRMPA
jgi:sensor c-di-GMP phosphodiesterase-like protein